MKEKSKSIKTSKKKISINKLLITVVLLAGIVFSYTKSNTIANYLKSNLAAGDVPAHEKTLTSNGDGTYKLSLTIKGDAEEKTNDTKANVIVVMDISGSMDYASDNRGRTSNTYGGYGYVADNDYRRLYYRTGTSGNYKYYPEGTGPDTSSHATVYYKYDSYSNGSIHWRQYTGTRYNYQSNGVIHNDSRLQGTQVAVKSLVNTLLGQNKSATDDMIELAFVTFSTNANYVTPSSASATGWIKGNSTTSMNETIDNTHVVGATNWDEALYFAKNLADAKYNSGDHDKTYIVFFSDGNPTVYGHGSTSSGESNSRTAAYNTADTLNSDKYDLYGILAYGDSTGQGYMRNLVSHGNWGNTSHATGNVGGFYYQASNETEIKAAFDAIASSIANAVGVGEAEIDDGTTASVTARSGNLEEEGLLKVDQNSYEYWMTIPLTNGKYTVFNNYNKIGAETFTFTQNGENVTISWGTGDNAKTATYKGKISEDGSSAKIQWGSKSNKPQTDFYFVVPEATYDAGRVKWDLDSVDTLLNNVTYEVTFDVWPTQTTLDLIADAKNGKALPDNVKPYLDENGNFKTNTDAKITFDDTRNGTVNREATYTPPNPVEIENAEMLSITKTWTDANHENSMNLYVNRTTGEKTERYHSVALNDDNKWKETVYVSYGIMKVNKTTHTIEIVTPGHDFSFAEPEDLAYNWEFSAPVVHPMIINAEPTLLEKVETKDLTCSMDGVEHCSAGSDEFYKIDNKYYKVTGSATASLTADNVRKSTLDIKKVVEGVDKNPNQLFTFNVNLNTNNSKENEVWFSIYDPAQSAYIINTTEQYVNTATLETFKLGDSNFGSEASYKNGIITYSKKNADGSFKEEHVYVGDNYDYNTNRIPTGYYYTSNPANVGISIKESWSLRFRNIPTGSTYTITETNDGGDDYRLKALSLKVNDKDVEGATDKENAKITGTVSVGNSYHLAQFTNEYLKTHVDVTKVWSDNDNQDGKRQEVTVELYRNNDPTGITKTLGTTQNAKVTFDNIAKFDANGNDYTYKVVETTNVSEFGYTKAESCTKQGEITSCTITNSHTPEITTISGKKSWSDDDNRDNLRPTSVFVQLHKTIGNETTDVGEPVEVNASTKWEYKWEKLPVYSNGTKIVYTVTENLEKDSKYTPEVDEEFNITNNYEAALTAVKVTKEWDDAEDIDGFRPENVSVTLTPDDFKVIAGTTQQPTVVLSDANNWTYTWTNLFVNNTSHQNNNYSVVENPVPGKYTAKITNIAKEGDELKFNFLVKNSHTPETTELSGNKVWDDNSNQDGVRPTSVTLKLYADGEYVSGKDQTISVKDAVDGDTNTWAYAFENLPKYTFDEEGKGGKAIVYTVEETLNFPEGKTASYSRSDDGTNIINSYTPEEAQIRGIKHWVDDDNRDGVRPTSVKIRLYADGVALSNQLKIAKASEQWAYSFTGLPKYKEEGTEIIYTVQEEDVDENYKVIENADTAGKYDITNEHIPSLYNNTGELTLTKIWEDDSNRDGIRKAETFKLTATIINDENETITVPYDKLGTKESNITSDGVFTMTWDEGKNTSSIKITGLYMKYLGKDIKFSLEETSNTKGYTKGKPVSKPNVNPEEISITNTHEPELYNDPETGKITITKDWEDDDNRDGIRKEVQVKVKASTKTYSTIDYKELSKEGIKGEYTLTTEDPNSVEVTGLYKYYKGEEIKYEIEEVEVPTGYKATYEQGPADFKVTNTHEPELYNDPETGKITITKDWEDDDNRDGIRKEVQVKVKASTKTYSTIDYKELSKEGIKGEYTLTTEDPNSVEVTGLYKYYKGEEIKYEIEEVEVPTGYKATYEQGPADFKVTNTHEPELYNDPETGKITITKDWEDDDNRDGIRKEVQVKVKASTKTYSTIDYKELSKEGIKGEYTLTTEDPNSVEVTGLYKYYKGEEIKYEIEEVEVPTGYKATYEQGPADFKVTNTHEPELYNDPETGKITITKDWEDDDNRDGIRKEVQVKVKASTKTYSTIDYKELSKEGIKGEYTLTTEDPNSVEVTGLYKYYKGEEIKYEIEEVEVPTGYKATYEQGPADFKVTNTHEPELYNDPETGKITITKDWEDDDNRDGIRKEVQVKVKASTKTYSTIDYKELSKEGIKGEYTLTTEDPNSVEVTGLYKYYKGEEIKYEIEEVEVPTGYKATYEQGPADFKVTNTHEPELYNDPKTGELKLTKIWDDDNNNDGYRTDVTFKIIATITNAEGQTVTVPYSELGAVGSNMSDNGEFIITVAPNSTDRNSFTITKLYKNYQGYNITYKVTEIGSYDGYQMVGQPNMTNPGEFFITNKHNNDTKTISGVKTWNDEDDRDGVRPESITIKLNKTVNGSTSVARTKVLPDNDSDNPWAYIFEDLPIKEGGQTITYTITETMSSNSNQYDSNTSNLSEVINTHDPFSTNVTVTKVWDDADDQDGLRKDIDSVTVTLSPASFKPITAGNNQNATQVLSDNNSWTHTWTDLYKMSGGKDIAYTVTENPVPEGYEAKVSYAQDADGKEISNQIIVTNKHTPEKYNNDGKLTITKIWDDDDNRDNKRANVTVELTATTASGLSVELPKDITNPITLTTKDNDSVTIEGLAKYYKGEEIIYNIVEVSYPNSYTPSYDTSTKGSFKVTNTLTPEHYNNEKGEITITKSWDDDNNRDGLRKSVDVKLIATANDEEVPYSEIADENSNLTSNGIFTLEAEDYTVTVTGLYKNYKGNPITYTIEELTEIEGYNEKDVKPTYTQGPKDFIVENHHTPEYYNNEKGEITITKSWDDDNNRDGLRKSVDVKLIATANDEEVPYSEIADENSNLTSNGIFTLEAEDYTVTVTGLYKNYKGNPITYTIEELTEIEGYNEKGVKPTYTQGPKDFIVENHHEIETAKVTITKSWIDDSNILGTRPTAITMHLFADGVEVTPKEGVTLTEANATVDDKNVWSYTFENLPVNSSNGVDIKYTVTEDEISNYTGVCPEGELTCINTVDNLKQEIKVTKNWDDNSDQDGKRDDQEAKVTLVGTVTIDGKTEEVYRSEEPLILGLSNPWEGSFTNIPIFHNGYRITYNVEENDNDLEFYSLSKKEMTENKDTHEISFELTNHHDIITKDYTVTKTWDDEDDNDGMRPESITIQLLDGDGNVVTYNEQTEFELSPSNATVDDKNVWSFTFEKLPVYSGGQEINYTVVEKVDSEKYERTDDLTTLDIINTHELETIDFTINKVWSDDNDRDGKRPESLTIQLLANGSAYGEPTTLTEANATEEDPNVWRTTFEGLPKYINGQPVEYTISEESVAYYTPGEVTPINNTYEDEEYVDADTYEFDGELENYHEPELVNEDDDDPDNDGQITVTKTWDDENNKYSSRPALITVFLYADDEEIGMAELTEENGWVYTFYEDYDGNPLYKYRDKGIEIVYTIGEIKVANYETIIDMFNITNKYNGPTESEIVPPNTGIISTNKENGIIELFIILISLISTVLFRKKLMD